MKALFAEWHDHALHWRTRRSLDAHLAACPPCAAFFQGMQETIVVVREWPGVEVPGEVRGHLRDLLRARHERKRKRTGSRCPCGPKR